MVSETVGLPKIRVCQHETKRIPRQANANGFYRIFSGGMRAAKYVSDAWFIEPILDDGYPCAKGFLPTAKLQPFFGRQGFTFIAFHRFGWSKGNYHSGWFSFIPGQKDHSRGPADLWSAVAGNLLRSRTKSDLAALPRPTREQIAKLVDARTEAERLASSISLSLRNMDMSVEQIAEFYNEQLVNHMSSGNLEGGRSSSTLDQTLFAHVHSFFMHLGAARDYLAAFCALRTGKDPQKVDSFARLTEVVRPEHFAADDLLRLFQTRGYFGQKPTSSVKLELAGWMAEVTDLRNELIHRRPYGYRFFERMGFAEPVDRDAGLYRYVRPIVLDSKENDLQRVILRHYQEMTSLCYAAAVLSGNDLSVYTIENADLISINMVC